MPPVTKAGDLRTILDYTPFLLTHCSYDLRYLYASKAYAEMIGRTPGDIAGKRIIDVMGSDGFETISPRVDAVLRGQRIEYEDEVHFAGVGPRLLHVIYVPECDEQSQVIGWIASIIDVTDFRSDLSNLKAGIDSLSRKLNWGLTERERVIFGEVVKGASSKEAARTLGIAPRTVEFHRAKIMKKLGVKNTAQLMQKALRNH
jgi:PAS domain S-box-containing protein